MLCYILEELIVSGSSDSTVRLWDMASNYDCKQILSNFGGSVKCLQLKVGILDGLSIRFALSKKHSASRLFN